MTADNVTDALSEPSYHNFWSLISLSVEGEEGDEAEIIATAYDKAGHSKEVRGTVKIDPTRPTVTIDPLADIKIVGDTYYTVQDSMSISGTATDNMLLDSVGLIVYGNGEIFDAQTYEFGQSVTTQGTYSKEVQLDEGLNIINATAYDDALNPSYPASVKINKDTTKPVLVDWELNRTAIGGLADTGITFIVSELLDEIRLSLDQDTIDPAQYLTSVKENDDGTYSYTYSYRWTKLDDQRNVKAVVHIFDVMGNSNGYEIQVPVDTKSPEVVEYNDYIISNSSPVKISLKFDELVRCRFADSDLPYSEMRAIDMPFTQEFDIEGILDTSKSYEEKMFYFQCIDQVDNMGNKFHVTYILDRLPPHLSFSSFGDYPYTKTEEVSGTSAVIHYTDMPTIRFKGQAEEGVKLAVFKFAHEETDVYTISEVVDETITLDANGDFDRDSITVGRGSKLRFVSPGTSYAGLVSSDYPDFTTGQPSITLRQLGDYEFELVKPLGPPSVLSVKVKENEGYFNLEYTLLPDTPLFLFFIASDPMGNKNRTYYYPDTRFSFPVVYDSQAPFFIPSVQPGSTTADKQGALQIMVDDGRYGSGADFSTFNFSLSTDNPNLDSRYKVSCGQVTCSCSEKLPTNEQVGCAPGVFSFADDQTFTFTPSKDLISADKGDVIIEVSVKDNVGHKRDFSFTYTIDTNAPADPSVDVEEGKQIEGDENVYTNKRNPSITVTYSVPVDMTLMNINSFPIISSGSTTDDLKFTYTTPNLQDGEYKITFNASRIDSNKFSYKPDYKTFIVDTIAPMVTVFNQDTKTPEQNYLITGECKDENMAYVMVDGKKFDCGVLAEDQYGAEVVLDEGMNTIKIEAFDKAGNSAEIEYEIELDLTVPITPILWKVPSATVTQKITLVGYVPGEDKARILASVQQGGIAKPNAPTTVGLPRSDLVASSYLTQELDYDYTSGNKLGIYDKNSVKYLRTFAQFKGHDGNYFERYEVASAVKKDSFWVNVVDFLVGILGFETQLGYSEIQLGKSIEKPVAEGEKVDFYTSRYPDSYFTIDIELFEGKNNVLIVAQNELGAYSKPLQLEITYDPNLALVITQVYPAPGSLEITNTEFTSKGKAVPIKVETNLEAECVIKHIADGTAKEFTINMQSPDSYAHTFTIDSARCYDGSSGEYTQIAGEQNWHSYLVTCSPLGGGMATVSKQICFFMNTYVSGSAMGGYTQSTGTPDLCPTDYSFGTKLTSCPKLFCDALYKDYDSCTAQGTGCTWCGVGGAGKCVNKCSECAGKTFNNDDDSSRCDNIGPCPGCENYGFACLCGDTCYNWGNNKGQCGGLLNCQTQFSYPNCNTNPSKGRCKSCPTEANCLQDCADCQANIYNNDGDVSTCDNLPMCDSCYPTVTPCKCGNSCFFAGNLQGNCGGEKPTRPTGICLKIGDSVVC